MTWQPPALKTAPYTLPDGLEVQCRALLLTERLEVRRHVAKIADEQSIEETIDVMIPRLLAIAVEHDGKPLMTPDQWNVYGGNHPAVTLELFNIASDLSGFSVAAAEKN